MNQSNQPKEKEKGENYVKQQQRIMNEKLKAKERENASLREALKKEQNAHNATREVLDNMRIEINNLRRQLAAARALAPQKS